MRISSMTQCLAVVAEVKMNQPDLNPDERRAAVAALLRERCKPMAWTSAVYETAADLWVSYAEDMENMTDEDAEDLLLLADLLAGASFDKREH